MSDYPPTPSYGTNYGSRDQANPPYLPPTYPNQYMQLDDGHGGQGHMASNYNSSMSAYAYNRAMPAFSAAAVASGVPPLPLYQGWNQDPIPLPPFNPPQSSVQYPPLNNNSQFGSQFYPSYNQPSYHSNAQPAKPYEQGELSEGEFEDTGLATNTPPVSFGASPYTNGANYADNSTSNGYTGARELNTQHSHSANNHQYPRNPSAPSRRQQSGSYSPYVPSPVADHNDHYSDQRHNKPHTSNLGAQHETSPTPQIHNSSPQKAADVSVQATTRSNGHHNAQSESKALQAKSSAGVPTTGIPSLINGKSLAESRKKAEAAILNLLPYNVRYQTYLEEGFREEFVGPLFDGLKVPRNSIESTNAALSHPTPTQNKSRVSSGQSTSQVTNDRLKGALDKVTVVTSEPQAQLKQPAAPVPKSAAMTEKERTLQSKMDALRKSREERTKKQAAAKDAKPVVKPNSIPAPAVAPVEKAPVPESDTQAKTTTTVASSPPVSSISKSQSTSNPTPSKSVTPAIVPQLSQQPSIPGLFLASNGIPGLQLSASGTPSSSTLSAQRKRPVAADFDDPVPPMVPHKRPFGYHRNDRPLIINVSEDEEDAEDEDVAMDLDSAEDQDSPVQSERRIYVHRPTVPQISAQTAKKVNQPFTPPPFPSASNTPPLPSGLSQAVRNSPAYLETTIKELKRQIAEKEARRLAKQTPSRALTPRPTDESSELKYGTSVNGNIQSKGEPSTSQELVTNAQEQVMMEHQQKLIDAKAAEVEKAAERTRNELEQKRVLREKNAAKQALVDAEVLQSQAKLEELRAAVAEAEAAHSRKVEAKQRLKEEAEQIEQQTELQVKKLAMENTARQYPPPTTDHPIPSSKAVVAANLPPTTNGTSNSTPEESDQSKRAVPSPTVASQDTPMQVDQTHHLSNVVQHPANQESNGKEDDKQFVDAAPSNQALEAALQEAVRAEADLHTTDKEDGEVGIEMDVEMDLEDSYAPDPNRLAPESTSGVSEEKEGSTDYSPALDRTAPSSVHEEMEDSPSYSPVLDRNGPETQERDDEYEPPEATEPFEASVPDSPPFSPAPPDIVPDSAMDDPMEISPPNPEQLVSALEHKAEADELDVNPIQSSRERGHNGAGELLPSVIGSSPKLVEPGFEDVSKTPKYTPYESPLKRFRAYRFHPEFSHDVSGGLRSKTYSHKIDPNKEFCRYELTGGVCNDSTCDLQHFKDIVLPDDAVLTALGSPEEFKDEQRDKFCEGLKSVLMGLRVRKIRDFDIIAAEIVAHRAKFLGDKSKVLALEGTTI